MGSRSIAAVVPLLSFLAACSHAQPKPAIVEPPKIEAAAPAEPAPAPAPQVASAPPEAPPAPPPRREGPDASFYFPFDDSTLDADALSVLEAVAEDLAKDAQARVRVEGNCDERGTSEYNLALGQRRADAARRYLEKLGVADDRISAVSLGEEHPRSPGHDEPSWRINRRDDVFVAQPPAVGSR